MLLRKAKQRSPGVVLPGITLFHGMILIPLYQNTGKRVRAGCASGKEEMRLWSGEHALVACTRTAFKLNKSIRESNVRSKGGEK